MEDNAVKTLTPANRFKLVLSAMAQSVRNENQISDFLGAIPNIINHIVVSNQIGIFTKEETLNLLSHIMSLKESLLL